MKVSLWFWLSMYEKLTSKNSIPPIFLITVTCIGIFYFRQEQPFPVIEPERFPGEAGHKGKFTDWDLID